MRAALLTLAAVLASRSSADASTWWRDLGGGAQLHYELASVHDIEHDDMRLPPSSDLVMAAARLHGFVGGKRWGYHMGLDLGAGSTIRDAGFAYDVSLFPVGLALRFAQTSFITVGAGIGAAGAVGTMNDAMTLPLELRFEVGRGIRVLGRARATYLRDGGRRSDGGVTTNMADELEATLALRLGHGYNDWGYPTGNGYFVGATAREAYGARFVGLIIGYSVDMGTPRKQHEWNGGWTPSCPDCE
jgi:hypothetical protein